MRTLRNRLIVFSLVATIVPLAATIWISSSLLDRSLSYATTEELDRLSRTLEDTVRRFYQREREALRGDAEAGRLAPRVYAAGTMSTWPDEIRSFWASGEAEGFELSRDAVDQLIWLRRAGEDVRVYSRDLGATRIQALSAEFRRSRELIGSLRSRDLRRGFTLTLLLLVAIVWVVSLAPLVLMAYRISRPIAQLTDGLTDFAAGNWDRRIDDRRQDEVGAAIAAFNRMAAQMRADRDRLVYLTQMSSWQMMARKTAHELKNSLTPIRLTVEEMLARQPAGDRAFMTQATEIVVSEIESLERWVKSFSEFASEPVVAPEALDINAIVRERVTLLQPARPTTSYTCQLGENRPQVYAGGDLVKSLVTNLLENAADAAGPGGDVLVSTSADGGQVRIEVHDSGPGLSDEVRATLFEPTITFKKHGMGLGLSIVRKNALLSGGDVRLIDGKLGGAGFLVVLPAVLERHGETRT